MKPNLGTAFLSLAVLLSPLALRAEDPDTGPSFAFKLRGLLSAPPTSSGLTNNVVGDSIELGGGFGLEAAFPAGPGKFAVELGYAFQTGDEYLANTSNMPGSTPSTVITQAQTVESRKNKIEGMMLRLGWVGALNQDWSWRAGLQFGGNTFTHQVIGNVAGTSSAGTFFDSYYYTGTKGTLDPSPFAGFTYAIDSSSAIELGLLVQQYTELNYQHVANTANQLDTVAESKRLLPTLEFAYTFRF